MADHIGVGGNIIHADEQPTRSEMEGVVNAKGSQESGRRQPEQAEVLGGMAEDEAER